MMPWPAAARARRRRRRYTGLAAGVLIHGALLAGLGLGLLDDAPQPDPVVITLDLTPIGPVRPAPPRSGPRAPASSKPSAPAARAALPATPAPAAPPRPATAPPIGVRAGTEPVGPTGPIGTQAAIRASSGCESADYVRLNPTERARCEARDKRLWAANPKTYAAVDPAKKDFFDGACKRDDDWCLYRTGQGPYPGLLALGKKKKRD